MSESTSKTIQSPILVASYECLLCGTTDIGPDDIASHKKQHGAFKRYGLLWPEKLSAGIPIDFRSNIPTYSSPTLAHALGVSCVYIRNEGVNHSGSMKDYIVRQALAAGRAKGFTRFSVVSSGNHAVSLAMNTDSKRETAILFTPSSSSKIPFLITFPHVVAVGMHDALIEDVYNLVTQVKLNGIYDINAHNECLLPGLIPVASDVLSLDPLPTHVLAGVGNGTYLAGIGWGLKTLSKSYQKLPKIIPVGMKGAFPSEDAYTLKESIVEYSEFFEQEDVIDAAEGSIAIESYSMPQLMHAVSLTKGFPLGELTNRDLAAAYELLATDAHLIARGAIPEPTGIMGLAAALKWKDRFTQKDVLHCSFTGHGVKDLETISRILSPALKDSLIKAARRDRPDLLPREPDAQGISIHIPKDTDADKLNMLLRKNTSVLDPIE
ncbi:MAG: pyridoxal-phosphate dependent enzyme [Patescibacteria group bacterium]